MWPFNKKEEKVVVDEVEEVVNEDTTTNISSILTLLDFEQPRGILGYRSENDENTVTSKILFSKKFSKDLNEMIEFVGAGELLLASVNELLETLPILGEGEYFKFVPPKGINATDTIVYLLQKNGVFWLEISYDEICNKYEV